MVSEKAAVADNAATEKAAAAEKAAHMKAWDLAVRRDKAAAGSPKLLPIEIRRREAMETAQKIRLSVEAEKAAKKACEKIKKAEEQAVARKKQLAIKAAKKLARNQAKKKAELAKTKAEQRALETDKHAKAIPSEAPSEPRMPEPTSEKHGQTTGEVVAASMLHLRGGGDDSSLSCGTSYYTRGADARESLVTQVSASPASRSAANQSQERSSPRVSKPTTNADGSTNRSYGAAHPVAGAGEEVHGGRELSGASTSANGGGPAGAGDADGDKEGYRFVRYYFDVEESRSSSSSSRQISRDTIEWCRQNGRLE